MDKQERNDFRKYKITARKHNGDDLYSWAVFINGRVFVNGLGRREVAYYKRRALEQCKRA